MKHISQDRLDELRQRINTTADKLGMPVDEGIKKLVVALWAHDFPTSSSCAGHFENGWVHIPYVAVEEMSPMGWRESKELQAQWTQANLALRVRLAKLLAQFELTRDSKCRLNLRPRGIFGATRLEAERNLPDEQTLKLFQVELDAFAEYLLSL